MTESFWRTFYKKLTTMSESTIEANVLASSMGMLFFGLILGASVSPLKPLSIAWSFIILNTCLFTLILTVYSKHFRQYTKPMAIT